ncbi:hypothetical protein NDU88_009186 [Pleurodeles waltl]|uniref:Uncharacterized protein n=1 Tax=Pleurodeles waltl TaxID=8319 RepID=A0AAV7NYB3_PLEWA|nr:hypothetical protein NDU88_009186 [Pleurodeles waltl]
MPFPLPVQIKDNEAYGCLEGWSKENGVHDSRKRRRRGGERSAEQSPCIRGTRRTSRTVEDKLGNRPLGADKERQRTLQPGRSSRIRSQRKRGEGGGN